MTDTPRRIQLSRAKGWRMPPNAVKVDRTSKWGNPYVVGQHDPNITTALRVMVSSGCTVKAFRAYALRCLEIDPSWLDPLRGRDLACWCPLQFAHPTWDACHADVLLELANPTTPTPEPTP